MNRACSSSAVMQSLNDEPYRRLWATVLWQAVRDLNQKSLNHAARHYIFGPRKDAGSAQWICENLGFDIEALRTLCMTRAGRSKILRNNGARRGNKSTT